MFDPATGSIEPSNACSEMVVQAAAGCTQNSAADSGDGSDIGGDESGGADGPSR